MHGEGARQPTIPPTPALQLPPAGPERIARSRRLTVAGAWLLAQGVVPLGVMAFALVRGAGRADGTEIAVTVMLALLPVCGSIAVAWSVWAGIPRGVRLAYGVQWAFLVLTQAVGVLLLYVGFTIVPTHDYLTYAPRPPADVLWDRFALLLTFAAGTAANLVAFGVPIVLLWPWRRAYMSPDGVR